MLPQILRLQIMYLLLQFANFILQILLGNLLVLRLNLLRVHVGLAQVLDFKSFGRKFGRALVRTIDLRIEPCNFLLERLALLL